MTASLEQTRQPKQPKALKRTSIQRLLVQLALVPAVVTGLSVGGFEAVHQRARQRQALLEGVSYATQFLASHLDNVLDTPGLDLGSQQLRIELQTQAENLIYASQQRRFPIRDILLLDQLGRVEMASSSAFSQGGASVRHDWHLQWRTAHPALTQQLADLARPLSQQALARNREVQTQSADRSVLISLVALERHQAVAALLLDARAIERLAQDGLKTHLLLITVLALLSGLLALWILRRLAVRLQALSAVARQIASAKSVAELEFNVPTAGRDELTELARDLDRLRLAMRFVLARAERPQGE